MLSRSFYNPIVTLLALIGCGSNIKPIDQDLVQPDTQVDTGQSDVDPATQALIDEGQRYNYWVDQVNPYIYQNEDWTYTPNWSGFVASTETTHPEVFDHYSTGCPANADTVVIDDLINEALPLANSYALQEYQNQLNNGTPPPWVTNNSYWWGRQSCFAGSDASWMLGVMSNSSTAASTIGNYVGAPGWLIKAYLNAMVNSAKSCNASKAYFCISYSYSGVMWISC